MRILLVAPGPLHSTFDVFNYYLDAMRDNNDIEVQAFSYHNITRWHQLALKYYVGENATEEEIDTVAVSRAARELLADIATFEPDIVFSISGLAIPMDVWRHVLDFRQKLIKKFAIGLYFTESPYMDELQSNFNFADILFINDKYSVPKFDPHDNRHVYYLPHSYNPKVHRLMNETDSYDTTDYKSDVFFCGTPFYERSELLAGVNWGDINFKLVGNWRELANPLHFLRLEPYVVDANIVPNDYMAKFYQNTKIALNIHRTRGDLSGLDRELNNYADAYSIGPRIYEAVACGAFVLTDYRREALDIFDASIGYFDTSSDLEQQVKYWLQDKNESTRQELAMQARERIQNCTFTNRLNNIVLPVFDEVIKTYLI